MHAMRDNFSDFTRHFLLALQNFTRLPVTGGLPDIAVDESALLRASAAHFPGVGLAVGGVACMVFAVTSLLLPQNAATPWVAAFVCTIATVLFTGAMHEDGFAHVTDGLASSTERHRALQIMSDSLVGSYGLLAMVLVVGSKVALLAVLALQSPSGVITALLAAHAVSRLWPLVLAHTLDHVGGGVASTGDPLAARIDRRGVALGALWCLAPLLVMTWAGGLAFALLALLASGAALYLVRAWYRRRLEGFTHECVGGAQQVCELAFYFGAALGAGR